MFSVESFGPSQNGHAASIKSGGRTTSVQVVPGVGSPDARGLCPLQMPTRVHLHVTHDTHQHMILGMIAHEPLHHALAHHKRWANFDINATYGYIAFHHLQVLSFTYRYTLEPLHLKRPYVFLNISASHHP